MQDDVSILLTGIQKKTPPPPPTPQIQSSMLDAVACDMHALLAHKHMFITGSCACSRLTANCCHFHVEDRHQRSA